MTKEFWDNKYADGGISGKGSVGKYKRWKWEQILNNVGNISNKSIIDVGCGDMRFWQSTITTRRLRKCKTYLGIDYSKEIIDRNVKKYPDRKFLCLNAKYYIGNYKADIVLAMDLLFHIINERDFEDIIDNLCKYSNDWIIIYNWINNPFDFINGIVTDGISQYYRNLINYDLMFISNDFELKNIIKCPYDPYGALYIYRGMIY